MDLTQVIDPFELGDGEQYFLVYVDKDASQICSISLEVVIKSDVGDRQGKRVDVALDYHNKPKRTPKCYTIEFNESNMQAFSEFKKSLTE